MGIYNNLSTYIEKISCQIDGNSVGFDLSQDENFFQIKSEISKLENIAADKIKATCIQLLCDKSKDLRLFVYLIFACLIESDSLDEWHRALGSLMACLVKYESALYPIRPAAKMVALSWLNQERVKQIFVKRIENVPYTRLVEYQQSVSRLNQWLAENTVFSGEKITLLFEEWLKAQIEVCPAPVEEISISQDIKLTKTENSEQSALCSTSFEKVIKNMNEVESATMLIVNYCELHGRLIQAASFRRSLRWSALMPKVDNGGVTALSEFSKKNEALLSKCQEDYINTPKECYKKFEELFLLPGGQVKLDIQYYAIQAAQLFSLELAEFIKEALYSFVKRFPGVENWQYNNKENCTSLMVRKWIQETMLTPNNVDIEKNENDKYKMILEERELSLLKKICGIIH